MRITKVKYEADKIGLIIECTKIEVRSAPEDILTRLESSDPVQIAYAITFLASRFVHSTEVQGSFDEP